MTLNLCVGHKHNVTIIVVVYINMYFQMFWIVEGHEIVVACTGCTDIELLPFLFQYV